MEKIFDKDTIQEKQELAALFGELAYNQIHEISKRAGWKDADPRKATLHAIVGGIMAKLGDGNFLAGASGAAVNELMQKELSKIKDPALHQWASAALGAAVGGMTGGKNGAQSGAGTAARGTKENKFLQPTEEVGFSYEDTFWGHIGVVNMYTDEKGNLKFEEGNMGRYRQIKGVGSVASPIGEGQYLFKPEFEPKNDDTSAIYVFNVPKEIAQKIVNEYNDRIIQDGRFDNMEDEREKGKKGKNIILHSPPKGTKNYKLWETNCATTSIAVLAKYIKYFPKEAQETFRLIKDSIDPHQIDALFKRDLIINQGKGMIKRVAYKRDGR